MEEETGLMKVKAETMTVAAHFFFLDQLEEEGVGVSTHKRQDCGRWLEQSSE